LAASTAFSGDGVSRGESDSAAATFSWMRKRSLPARDVASMA